ncbi:MAG: DUF2384 domain-containing protein [Gammaproteobacteria bacterium]|nr:DUF2384 domain-containing protein [Gammaproteobacteria bacterium]
MSSVQKTIATPKKGKASALHLKTAANKQIPAADATIKRQIHKSRIRHPLLATRVAGMRLEDRKKMQVRIKQGFAFDAIIKLGKELDLSQKALGKLLSISPSTLNRRKKDGHLRADESDRVARFARLKDAALIMMQGNDQAAIQWLRTPLDILAGDSPLDHSVTELGARDVEELIGRIEHGVFS